MAIMQFNGEAGPRNQGGKTPSAVPPPPIDAREPIEPDEEDGDDGVQDDGETIH